MLPFIVEQHGETVPSLHKNEQFEIERFRMCGGILNSRFWDINLRYASAVCSMKDDDVYALMIANLSQWLLSLDQEDTQISKNVDKKKVTE